MSSTLSRKERKIKFKSLAFAALQKSTGNETICVQVGAHDGKRWDLLVTLRKTVGMRW